MNGFDPTRLLGPLVVVMAIVLLYSSRLTAGKVKETSEGLVFAVKPVYAWSRMLVLPVYMGFFLWIAWRQSHAIPWPIVGLCIVAIFIGLLQLPGTITLTPMAVTQRFWLQSSKSIPYGEITNMLAMQGGRTILVIGENRAARIRHSANHAAAEEFRRELERRTGKHILN
jgi:hypothetical protein